MIEIKIDIRRNIDIEARGHSLFDVKGKDIICASVSVLLQSYVLSIKELTDSELTEEKDEGYLRVSVKNHLGDAMLLFNSLILSLNVIAREHPENVKLTILKESED